MSEKVLSIIIKALLQEFMVESIEDLLVLCARKGIKVTMKVASDIYYDYQWKHRKQIDYRPLQNPNIKIAPATNIKRDHKNTYC